MFSQVPEHRARTDGGLGIGLALACQLVELHGGTIEALSEGLGHGSEFVLRLPLVSGAETAGTPDGEGVRGAQDLGLRFSGS